MREACSLVWSVLVLLFRSRVSLEAEILILRHQLNIQRRHLPKRLTFSVMDRLIGIRDRPTSPRSPWQNAYAERLIGSIRRECLDHVVVLGERHLRHVLLSYMNYYNGTRTHLSLDNAQRRPTEYAG
jgi:transposase InsO family protein